MPSTVKDTRLDLTGAVPTSVSPSTRGEPRGRVVEQVLLVGRDARDADPAEVVDRGAEADRAADVRRAGLEAVRQVVPGRALEGHREDHVAAALPGRHGGEQRLARVEHADAGRAVHLVRGERVEVAAERLHVHGQVRDRLGAVDHGRDPALAGRGDEIRERQHRAERVRDVGEGDDARARAEQAEVGLEVDDAAPVDRHDAKRRARLRGEQLPGHDVRVVLEARDDDLVAGGEPRAPVRLGDEVDRLGRPADEDDFRGRGRVHEAARLLARALVQRGRLLRQRVHAAVHVGVMGARVVRDGVDDRRRLLRRGGVVEVGEGMAVDPARERGKVGAHAGHVERDRGFPRGGHQTAPRISSRSGRAPATRASAASRTAASGTRPIRSRQNAKVSSARAAASSRPRDRR